MPQNICEECSRLLSIAYEFKAKCEQSEQILRSYVVRRNTLAEISNEMKEEETINVVTMIKPEITIDDAEPPDPLNEKLYDTQSNDDFLNCYKSNDEEIIDAEIENNSDGDGLTQDNFELDETIEISEVIDYKSARNEHGRYTCQICEKTLADAKGLKLHIRLHTGSNLKICHICNKGIFFFLFI